MIWSTSTRSESTQAKIVVPENMARKCAQVRDDWRDRGWRARRIGVFRVADDANHAILRKRACSPRSGPCLGKPSVCRVVPSMARVDQRDQHIDVDKKSHDISSRSALTISAVTITPGLRTGSSGTLFVRLTSPAAAVRCAPAPIQPYRRFDSSDAR